MPAPTDPSLTDTAATETLSVATEAVGSSRWLRSPLTVSSWRGLLQRSGTQILELKSVGMRQLGLGLLGFWGILTAGLALQPPHWSQVADNHLQSVFFELRGVRTPPDEVLLLTIDDHSLSQGGVYRSNPQAYSTLEPIQSWPWKRAAYAQVLDRLVGAGARVVAFDLLLSGPSSYGPGDDQSFHRALRRHGQRVVLASQYTDADMPQGPVSQYVEPLPEFGSLTHTGFVNFPLEPDGKIHRFGEAYLQRLAVSSPDGSLVSSDADGTAPEGRFQNPGTLSFATAILRIAQEQALRAPGAMSMGSPLNSSAQVSAQMSSAQAPSARVSLTARDRIYFYGPQRTLPHISFWEVLDPITWRDRLKNGAVFQGRIVLIGSTVPQHQDFHQTPFTASARYPAPLSGVEIHGNAVASLLEGKVLRDLLPLPWQVSLWTFGLVMLMGGWIHRVRGLLALLAWTALLSLLLCGLGFAAFFAGAILPLILPLAGILGLGVSQLTLTVVQRQLQDQQLRTALKSYATVPVVREIISGQEGLRDLLLEREAEMRGRLLGHRYRIVNVLGTGGFSETYTAEDTQRPGNPLCVVKQLKLANSKPNYWKLLRRLFKVEAESLERLGRHPQIPQLLASFEENYEFYVVQELIVGQSLHQEISQQGRLSLQAVVVLLNELLDILDFVHSQGIIHRDIKPTNILRRAADHQIVLIDFGVAKKLSDELASCTQDSPPLTIGIGTKGYMPVEQMVGRPHFSSDLYALGMTAIEALTGVSPNRRPEPRESKGDWQAYAPALSPAIAQLLETLTHPDYTQRYTTAREAREALRQTPEFIVLAGDREAKTEFSFPGDYAFPVDIDGYAETQPWPELPSRLSLTDSEP